MGCGFSKDVVKTVKSHYEDECEKADAESLDEEKGSFETKSDNSFFSSRASIESDKITLWSGCDILAPHMSKSVDLSRKGSANKEDPPVAMATIFRGAPTIARINNSALDVPHPCQPDNVSILTEGNITESPKTESRAKRHTMQRRRLSEGDIGKVMQVTCIPPSLIKGNPLLSSSLSKVKPLNFGPRNSRQTTLTDSQKDFFRMLDEKVDQGKDYCSEDERSLASYRSVANHRKGSSESTAFSMGPLLQVR